MTKLHTVVDNFNNNSIDTAVWAINAGGIVASGGRVVITPSTANRQLYTNTIYDATSSSVRAQLPVVTQDGFSGTLQCGMGIIDGTNTNIVAIRKLGNQLVCSYALSGTESQISFAPYSATNHLWWRIRLDASNVYWETSANGVGWFIQATTSISALSGFNFSLVKIYFFANYTGTEASPGTFAIETVNPILLVDASGNNPAPSFVNQSVTNNTNTTLAITASGATVTTGSAALTILSGGTGSSLRDLAGNLAPGFTNQPVSNETVSVSQAISATGTTTTTGFGRLGLILALTATGTSGRGILYDENIPYDSEAVYDPNFTAGNAALEILSAGATAFITASGTTATTGAASLDIVAAGGITGHGFTGFTGSAVLEVPTVHISAAGIVDLNGTARLGITYVISASGAMTTLGAGNLTVLTPLFTFEPPIAYDLPPTLPRPRPRYINAHARWKGGQRRGRTVLKTNGVYSIVDTPTVNQTLAADIVYMGGHVYTIDSTEASALRAAGFVVSGRPR